MIRWSAILYRFMRLKNHIYLYYETLLATFLGLIVLSLMVYLAHSSSRENKYLIHLSEIDPLISVFNKETTQKLIDQKLNVSTHLITPRKFQVL